MAIIRQLTEAEADIAWKESLVLRVAEAANHLASTLDRVNHEFYNTLSTERLVALLNADIEASIASMQANTELGTPANAWLDALGLSRFSARAPLAMGRTDIMFDGTQFIYVAPPEPEPEPEPEPDPEPPVEEPAP